VLAAARALAPEQGQHDAERAVQAGPRVVGDQVERDHRLLAPRVADEVQHARQREVVHVVRRVIAIRTVLAEARQRAIDDARVQRANRLVVGAEALHHTGPEALDDDVGRRGQLAEDRLAVGRLHVERHRPLVAVGEGVDRAAHPLVAGGSLRIGRLDLEDLGAHVGQHHRRHLGRRDARELENLDPVHDAHRATPGPRRAAK
jgi:hypothetical protein